MGLTEPRVKTGLVPQLRAKDLLSSAEVFRSCLELEIHGGDWVEGLLGIVGETSGKLRR